MKMHWIDWTIIVLLLGSLIGITAYAKIYMRSVADFLAANRLAGRYMLTVSGGLSGAISIIAGWEALYNAGLSSVWWGMIGMPIGLILGISGFIIYRFRQTRALTLAQFFEIRYSRQFRYFAGFLCWVSGVFNYGIFPLISARAIIYFFGLPEHFHFWSFEMPALPLIMAAYLSIALYIACTGGQISIMIADFYQGILLMLIFTIILCFLMYKFEWNDIIAGLLIAPESKSMINPFKAGEVEDFNIWFFLIGVFGMIYNARSWQGNSGFNAAAKTPHEAQMAGIIGSWRSIAAGLCGLMIPLAAYAVLHLPKFAEMAVPIHAQIAAIADPQLQKQMIVPLFLSNVLPVGMMGLFAAVIVASAIGCDNSYLHSWGTILVQDVLMPIRNKPLEPKRHLLWLRVSIISVALFGFTFSMLFQLKDYIYMFFALTGAIYLGGAGAVIIGGLYWKRGTTEAAWTALILGTIMAFGGMLIQNYWATMMAPVLLSLWPDWQWVITHKARFPLNGQEIYFYAMIAASLSYVLVSLLGPKHVFDMDKMLHCGKYAVKDDVVEAKDALKAKRKTFGELIGVSKEFSKFERFLFWGSLWLTMGWWGFFVVVTVINLFYKFSDAWWSWVWWAKIWWVSLILGIVCTTWIFCGGVRDAYRMFRDLKAERVDNTDDGTVKK